MRFSTFITNYALRITNCFAKRNPNLSYKEYIKPRENNMKKTVSAIIPCAGLCCGRQDATEWEQMSGTANGENKATMTAQSKEKTKIQWRESFI